MQIKRSVLILSAVCLSVLSPAQAGESKPSPILGMIPDDATAYILANDLKSAMHRTDAMVKELGIESDVIPASLLDALKTKLSLGDGFRPENGAALVIMNLTKFGYEPNATHPLEQEEIDPTQDIANVPWAIYLPGKSIATTLPNAKIKQCNGYSKLTGLDIPMPVYAIEKNNFVILSPNPKVLESIRKTKVENSAAAKLDETHGDMATESELFIHVNWKSITAYSNKYDDIEEIKGFVNELEIPNQFIEMIDLFKSLIKPFKQMSAEIISKSYAIHLKTDSVLCESLVYHKDDGILAESGFERGVTAKEILKGLPSDKYVLAYSGLQVAGSSGLFARTIKSTLDALSKSELSIDIPADTITRVNKILKITSEQITGVKFIGGGSEKGFFATSLIINCKDANVIKTLLAEEVSLLNDSIKKAMPDDEDLKPLNIKYNKNVETIFGKAVDTISITHPELDKLAPEMKQIMQLVLNTDKIRILVASPGKQTVILSFGGDIDNLSRMISTHSAPLLEVYGVKKAIAMMPKKLTSLTLLSPGTLLEVFYDSISRSGLGESVGNLPSFTPCPPVAFGTMAGKNYTYSVFVLPVSPIKETIQFINIITKEEQN